MITTILTTLGCSNRFPWGYRMGLFAEGGKVEISEAEFTKGRIFILNPKGREVRKAERFFGL